MPKTGETLTILGVQVTVSTALEEDQVYMVSPAAFTTSPESPESLAVGECPVCATSVHLMYADKWEMDAQTGVMCDSCGCFHHFACGEKRDCYECTQEYL